MISINTNKSSLIVQSNLANASQSLNQAVERMTTGLKLNHAKDNAANYSISTNMTTKIGAYSVAESNAGMGLDMLTTAQDTLGEISSGLSRLRTLAVQAQNGTYGGQSLSAINSEADAITRSINQLFNSAQYNGVKLLESYAPPEPPAGFNQSNMPKADYNGFIEDPVSYTDAEVDAMQKVKDVSTFVSGKTYSISSDTELKKLADYVNSGKDTTGVTFVLGDDIDLSAYQSGTGWTPIGDYSTNSSYVFKGTFDGNGHVITNLKINNPTKNYQGLFCYAQNGTIKNVGIVGADIKGGGYTGALVGYSKGTIQNCYMTGNVAGTSYVGGLVGEAYSSSITSSYATGDVTGTNYVGGLAGSARGSITSSYATGNVTGQDRVGGLAGSADSPSYITSSYATGNVTGQSWVGGLIGQVYKPSGTSTINDCISYSTVSGTNYVGSFIGGVINTDNGTSFGTVNITNSKVLSQGLDKISGCYKETWSSGNYVYTPNTNGLDAMLAGISDASFKTTTTELQVGIHGNEASRITLDMGLKYGIFDALNGLQMEDASAIPTIDEIIKAVSEKQTELGSASNRLESVLEEIATQYENLVSSRSTLRDTDVARESSAYIRAQILQQASATLLSTANQSPAIALTLLQGLG